MTATGVQTSHILNAAGCDSSITTNLTVSAPIVVTASPGVIVCNGGTTTVTVAATGGTGPYSGTGAITLQTGGSHTYTVTDSKGCTGSVTITIAQPAVLTATATGSISCNGGIAAVTVTASGGTVPYTGTGSFNSQSAGAHSYTVTDAHGCTAIATITLVNPTPIVVTATAGPIACFGGTGCATVSATGGTVPYTGTGNICGYTAGTYTITVMDVKGCTNTATVTFTEPTKVTGSVTTTAATCSSNNGTATVTTSGGTGAYTYLWNTVPAQTPQTATGLAGGAYTVTITDANGCTGITSGTVTITGGGPPPVPIFTSGSAGVCLNTTATYCVNAIPGATSYSWTTPNKTKVGIVNGPATITTSSNCITILFNGDYNGGFICVKATNPCGTGPQVCINTPVLSHKPAKPGNITGPVSICTRPTTITYSIAPVANATSYSWVVSGTGFTLATGQGTTSVTVNVDGGFTSGTVKVRAGNCVGNSDYRTLNIYGGVPTTPAWYQEAADDNQIVGVCGGSTHDYEVFVIPGVTSYTFTAPSGAVINDNNGHTGNPLTTSAAGFLADPEVSVTFPSGFVSGNITAYATNTCGNSSPVTLAVRSAPTAPVSITGSSSVCKSYTSVTYSIAAVAGATNYTWVITGGARFNGNNSASYTTTAASVTVKFTGATSGSATLTVVANNGCGSSANSSKSIGVNLGCRSTNDNIASTVEPVISNMKAYPNPTQGKLNLEFNIASGENYSLKVMDMTGRLVQTMNGRASIGENLIELDMSGFAKGLYQLSIDNGEEIQVVRVSVE